MFMRTDLALEANEQLGEEINGVILSAKRQEELFITKMKVTTPAAAERLGKPQGRYITIEVPSFTDNYNSPFEKAELIAKEIRDMLPKKGLVLVVGLGNCNITPDNLGPMTAENVLATRHITGELARSTGLSDLRPVAVLAPGVLGQTGIESAELIASVSAKLNPCAIIVIDALASMRLERLGCTIQLSDAGISPGAGVNNSRPRINRETLGIPVISMGVPTVVDAITLACDLTGDSKENLETKTSPRGEIMMVTPREIDLLIERAAKLSGMSINCALQPDFSIEDISMLLS